MKSTIYIIPLGEIDPVVLKQVQDGVGFAFGCLVKIMSITTNPSYAFEPRRQQYYSTKILDQLMTQLPEDGLKIIGVTEVDIATPVLTFVFGEAQLKGSAALISLTRLRQEFYQLFPNQRILLDRTVKEAIHELGHTFGLYHCDDPLCVMHFSPNITGIDDKELNFCPNCLTILQREIKI